MWCPNCKNEYRDGFTECFECHVPLVEELTEEMLASVSDEGDMDADFVDWANKHPEQIAKIQEQQEMLLKMEEAMSDEMNGDEGETPDVSETTERPVKAEVYQSKSIRAAEHYSSALTLLGVGLIGLALVILAATGVIPLNLASNAKFLSYGVMGAMFVIFIFVGIASFKSYKKLAEEGKKEDELTNSVTDWFLGNHNADTIDKLAELSDAETAEEVECYYKRMDAIRSLITEKAEEELAANYLEHLAESFYNSIYGSETDSFEDDIQPESTEETVE